MSERDEERNRFHKRARRYARVGTNVGSVAARAAGRRLLRRDGDREKGALELAAALGGLKGPIMKVAQLLATIPEALPAEYAMELAKLQSNAPPMGRVFVKRRMAAELGPDWQARFRSFDREAAASASLGQVHRAVSLDGAELACKLQYPDMQSAVEADLSQLDVLFAIHRRMDPAIDTSEMGAEIAARVREELDYVREAAHMRLYGEILREQPDIRVPAVFEDLSTRRLLTMSWLEGRPILTHKDAPQEVRNRLATAMFRAWWYPFSRYGVIHGDPHLGNYTVYEDDEGEPAGINLLDYGCIRVFPPKFVGGVIDLYNGLRTDDEALIVHAYETWGFRGLTRELIDILNIWARFIYGPLIEDKVRAIADGVAAAEYGRQQAFMVHKALKEKGPVRVPREFVFMDRAAIGLGAVFIHLRAELNFHRLFNETIAEFDLDRLGDRQADALSRAGVGERA
ncbi:AarF/ABC1/UbiB kinase family protein [Microbaculum marinum]|uniref:AarF/ABC1/UbiB kinase family protein n=1 Tax=Microbaculum marinum TaxID=1764581 RepID=A0AAW9RVQ8_9HYPH